MTGPSRRSRAPRPAITRRRLYRIGVGAALVVLAVGTAVVLALAAGVLLGILPYPGR